ncbi:response regulator transcription factor [Ilumatobacter sp.]|uniref:response regulator transcription factor n=1 Tax=Ilumatobacter sp. TaxID=1967498 RepID=UPI00374FFB54
MRVLVVEDEVRQAAPVQRGLEAEGFAVDVATNDVDGLWMATEQSYDVIVLDVMLPGLNGYRVCAELRARRVATPILMLIAKDGEFDEAEALDTGADDFLSKPFSSVVLVARLRALIRRGGSNRAPLLVVGDLAVDVAGRSCTMAGTPIALTPREFAIIEYLLVHQGEVVAKSDIVSHVWDSAFDGHDNVIETIRSGGYRIRAHV